jgi:hypothetical protein
VGTGLTGNSIIEEYSLQINLIRYASGVARNVSIKLWLNLSSAMHFLIPVSAIIARSKARRLLPSAGYAAAPTNAGMAVIAIIHLLYHEATMPSMNSRPLAAIYSRAREEQ